MTGAASSDGWKAVAGEMIEGARDAAFRFPVVALSLVALTIWGHLEIEDAAFLPEYTTWYLPLGLACAAIAALAATLNSEARKLTPFMGQCISAAAAVLAFLAIWYSGSIRVNEWVLPPALAGLVLVAPYLWRFSAEAFWLFAVRVCFAIMLGLLANLLLAGGISAILASLSYLFGFEIDSDVYLHVWVLSSFLIAPLFGLGRLPRWFHDRPAGQDYEYMAVGIRALGDFVAAPLLLVYALILHAYAAKIVITQDVPKGQIGWLVLGYGFCLFGALLISFPYWRIARAPMRLLLRIWPFVMPVPLLLLFYAAWLRIDQYGVTPERYLLVLYGIVATAIVAVQLIKPLRGDIRLVVVLPVAALCLASFGPQGVNGWSIRSQAARFMELVDKAKDDVEIEVEAVAALRYLYSNGGLYRVAKPEQKLEKLNKRGSNSHADFAAVARAYGLNPNIAATLNRDNADTGSKNLTFNKYFPNNVAVQFEGYDVVVPNISFYSRKTTTPMLVDMGEVRITVALGDRSITVNHKGRTTIYDLSEEMIYKIADDDSERLYPLTLDNGSQRLLMLVNHVHGEFKPELRVINISGALLLRSQDWPQLPDLPKPQSGTIQPEN